MKLKVRLRDRRRASQDSTNLDQLTYYSLIPMLNFALDTWAVDETHAMAIAEDRLLALRRFVLARTRVANRVPEYLIGTGTQHEFRFATLGRTVLSNLSCTKSRHEESAVPTEENPDCTPRYKVKIMI